MSLRWNDLVSDHCGTLVRISSGNTSILAQKSARFWRRAATGVDIRGNLSIIHARSATATTTTTTTTISCDGDNITVDMAAATAVFAEIAEQIELIAGHE